MSGTIGNEVDTSQQPVGRWRPVRGRRGAAGPQHDRRISRHSGFQPIICLAIQNFKLMAGALPVTVASRSRYLGKRELLPFWLKSLIIKA